MVGRSVVVVPAVAVVVGLGLLARSPLVVVTGSLVVALGLAEWGRRRRWAVEAARADALPPAVDHLVQQLRSGASLVQACRGLEADRLRPLVEALDRGATLVDATRVLGAGAGDPSVRLVATTLEVLATNGGPAVPALVRLRHTLVGRAHRRHRAEAQAASAVASAGLLAAAPALFAVVLSGAEPELAGFYLWEPLGAACATGSVALSAVGWFWLQRAVGRAGLEDR